jgi:eukaryotic-like serine/threonine-protein kinase
MVGQTLGSYKILRLLGAGAMGEVYLAEHRHLQRKAALKLLARELVGRPDLLERFFLEARATSAIAHPAIVQIFDCELDATGRPYIVMEFLEGATLGALLAQGGPPPPATTARLVRSMADGLEAAHAKGIVHRDLKPDNVFVQSEPPDTIKLVDFGIAKLAGDFRAGQVHQTRSGAMMGTPLYMSPEQCRDSAAIDYRTDIYSLGCVMFEMLTGRPPFLSEALGDLIVAHMTEPAPDARAVAASVPAPLAELTAEMLSKSPADRPASMRHVADRLAAFVGGLTTLPGAGAMPQPGPAAAAATAPAGKTTTFGDSASELVTDAEVPLVPARGRGRIFAGVAIIGVVAAAGAVYALRRPGGGAQPGTVAPPLAALAPAPAATPAAAPSPAAESPPAVPASRKPVTKKASSSRRSIETSVPASDRRAETPAADTELPAAQPAAPPTAPPPAPPPAPPAPATPPAAASDLAGAWEGPWVDSGRQQRGRFYLSIAGNGSVTGWMYNTGANQTFRMVGRMTPGGQLDLACQCPPNQSFGARGSLAPAAGEATGRLTLSTARGVFGQTQLSLRRTTAKH